ncbi:MAG: type 1 pili tip component [Ectothiorhodospiraceae bacterium]|nr:type 1 pili tip component [Chromatiales bacterium]MCP5156932.1 type 1 pili tip component [Ectothiorhodospiraceae bacterium]
MRVRELIKQWEDHAAEPLTVREYCIRLPVEDAARVAALAEIYPRRRVEDLLIDLLSAALDELEEGMPYVQGERIISEDDQGDPIYADAGPASRFRDLKRRFARDLGAEAARDAAPE